MFFDRGEDEVIRDVERKLSEWSLIPEGHGEGIQVLRYTNGQVGGWMGGGLDG
jgi:prolyl 4-hydroxylase